MSELTNSHFFAVRTTGGQEKVVLRLLETKMKTIEKIREELNGFANKQVSPDEEKKLQELKKFCLRFYGRSITTFVAFIAATAKAPGSNPSSLAASADIRETTRYGPA